MRPCCRLRLRGLFGGQDGRKVSVDDLGIIAQQVVGDIPQRGQGMAFVQQYHHAELPEHLTGERVFPQEVVQRGRMLRLPAHDAQIGGAGGDVADNGGQRWSRGTAPAAGRAPPHQGTG